jgi:transmembrane sensor
MNARGPSSSRQDEAARWFAAQRAGLMLAEDREAFDRWRSDPRNQTAFDAMHELWGELAALKDAHPPGWPRKPPSWRRRSVVASLSALVLCGVVFLGVSLSRPPTIETAQGEQQTQSLSDGSTISVNVVSRLSYSLGEQRRIVELREGEAAFSVRADPERPFVVRTGGYEVRAVGTAFNVRQRDGAIVVSVSEGRVVICAAGGDGAPIAAVTAGEMLRFPADFSERALREARPAPVMPQQVSEWRMRVVSYEDARLGDVVDDFNRYFKRPLLVEDNALRERRITVRLQFADRDRAISTLAALVGLRVTEGPGGEVLSN